MQLTWYIMSYYLNFLKDTSILTPCTPLDVSALNYNNKIDSINFFFFYMSTQEENERFELVTFASLDVILAD